MRVHGDVGNNYPEDPIRFLDFDRYADLGGELDFFFGDSRSAVRQVPRAGKRVVFHTEEQNSPNDSTDELVPFVDEILTICPPAVTHRQKRRSAFFPFNPSCLPGQRAKLHDVIYCGYAKVDHACNIVETIRQYNYRLVSFGGLLQHVTDVGVPYSEKLARIAESRCCVVHNLVSASNPQLKTRAFEAASCGSLMLCLHDSWNIIEEWFTPGEHFLYVKSAAELRSAIESAAIDWERHEPMVERAREHAMSNYTVEQFVRRYLQ